MSRRPDGERHRLHTGKHSNDTRPVDVLSHASSGRRSAPCRRPRASAIGKIQDHFRVIAQPVGERDVVASEPNRADHDHVQQECQHEQRPSVKSQRRPSSMSPTPDSRRAPGCTRRSPTMRSREDRIEWNIQHQRSESRHGTRRSRERRRRGRSPGTYDRTARPDSDINRVRKRAGGAATASHRLRSCHRARIPPGRFRSRGRMASLKKSRYTGIRRNFM